MEKVFASIITIGDELLIGQVVDTNSSYIARHLNGAGIPVRSRVAVGDNFPDILQTLEEVSRHSRIVLITGGLGPTKDDITKEALCKYFGGKLILNQAALDNVRERFTQFYKRPVTAPNIRQAMVPDTCEVLQNKRGTAPGMIFDKKGVMYVSMPGVPYEMEGMMEDVLVIIQSRFSLPSLIHKNILTAGIGESALAEKIAAFEDALPAAVGLAYLPAFGMVRLRLSASGGAGMQKMMDGLHKQLIELCYPFVVSAGGESLQEVVGQLLVRHQRTLSTAESCTGGAIAALLTSVPGASGYFEGSVVSYSNAIKERVLEVEADVLRTAGAVSEETVKQMVSGALKRMKTDYALAVSGIMGPAGGTSLKPVGTVWMAAGHQHNIKTRQVLLRYTRQRNIETTRTIALNFLREFILEIEGE